MNYILFIILAIYIFSVSKKYYTKNDTAQKFFLVLFFLVHFSAMGFAYNSNIIDAAAFYEIANKADSWFSLLGLGSVFMAFLIYPLVKVGVSLFILFFLFATISYQTFLMLFNQMSKNTEKGISFYGIALTQMLFLLPSLHYWSGFLGKDVLVFFFLTYLLFEIKKKSKVNILHLIVVLIFVLLRPHVFLATLIAFVIYYLTKKNVPKNIKIGFSILSLIIAGVLMPVLMFFAHIKTLTLESISEQFRKLNVYAVQSGSGISLIDTSYPERIWLLLFRPLFYDAKTIYQYIVSIENSIVLLIFIFGFVYLYSKRKTIVVSENVKLSLLVGSCILLMIATYIYNLGLASRMRLMFLPLLLYSLHQMVCFNFAKSKDQFSKNEK